MEEVVRGCWLSEQVEFVGSPWQAHHQRVVRRDKRVWHCRRYIFGGDVEDRQHYEKYTVRKQNVTHKGECKSTIMVDLWIVLQYTTVHTLGLGWFIKICRERV